MYIAVLGQPAQYLTLQGIVATLHVDQFGLVVPLSTIQVIPKLPKPLPKEKMVNVH